VPVLGFWDLVILAFLALLVFGPKRLPQMGRSMGESIRGFRDAITARHERQDAEADAERRKVEAGERPRELPPAQTAPSELRDRDTVL